MISLDGIMSTEMKSKIAYMPKELFDYFETTDKNFSKWVRMGIKKEMLGETPFDILVVENEKGVVKS